MTFEAIIITIIALIIISSAFSIFVFARKKKAVNKIISIDHAQVFPASGLDIPILVSYSGLKGLAPLTFGQNSLNPFLTLFGDQLAYKVLFRKSALYSEISSLRSFRSRYYNKLRFTFRDRPAFLTVVLGNEETLQAVLTFLAEKGIRPDDKSRM